MRAALPTPTALQMSEAVRECGVSDIQPEPTYSLPVQQYVHTFSRSMPMASSMPSSVW